MERKPYFLQEKADAFKKRVIRMNLYLTSEKHEFIMSKQVLRSGTSIGANIAESRFAQSPPDYVNKLSIALKEANETNYWITSLYEGGYLSNIEFVSIQADSEEIIKLLVSSIKKVKTKYGLK